MIGKEYFVRQATTLLKFAKTTKDPNVSAGLLQKATDLKSQIDQTGSYDVEARTDAASDRSNSRCGGFLYSAFAQTFRAFRGIDFATRLGWLFDLLKPRAIAGGANNLSQNFTRSFHRDQSLKQNKS
jgi:hypothetical protein